MAAKGMMLLAPITNYQLPITDYPFSCLSPNMNSRPLVRVGLGLAQDLAADRGGVAFAEGEELEEIGDRVALGPSEVRVRNGAGAIAQVQQQSGDRVRNRGARAAEHAETADVHAADFEHV